MPPILTKPTGQFLVKNMLMRGVKYYPDREIVSRGPETEWRYTYQDLHERVSRLANALAGFGIDRGDRVATLARNTHRHLELYFALPCMGSIVHPLNVMLPRDQLTFIINHAEDQLVFVDEEFLPLVEQLKDGIPGVRGFVVMTDREALPSSTLSPLYSYEQLLADAQPDYPFPEDLDEHEATFMAYSSGTTGMPRGTLYSHRTHYMSGVLFNGADHFDVRETDTVLHFVPMFHAAGWNMPYAATLIGAKQVYPGQHMAPSALCDMIEKERVSWAGAVPTVWLGIFDVAEREKRDISSLRTALIAGAPAPAALLQRAEARGINCIHGYGTTETTGSSITLSRHKWFMDDWPDEKRYEWRAKQGVPDACLELKVVRFDGSEVRWGTDDVGEVYVKSPTITYGHYNDPERTAQFFTEDGWMDTGDVGQIDEYGFLKIVDRSKDLIKSGGEWISSIDLENTIMAHPQVLEACVIGVPDPKWDERPKAWVVPTAEAKASLTPDLVRQFLESKVNEGKLAKWWLPDEIVIVDAIPRTGTGKFDKKAVRAAEAAARHQ